MTKLTSSYSSLMTALVLPVALSVTLSGCTLFGLGAAAGAAVGGCSLLDTNQDDRITETELSRGLYDDWDADDDDALTEDEFDAGVEQREVFSDWADDFDNWDADDDDVLTENEFESGVTESAEASNWADRRCDDLGL